MNELDFFYFKTVTNCESQMWAKNQGLSFAQCKWSISVVERTRKVMCWWKLHGMKVCCFHLNCGSRLQGGMWGVQTLAWNLQRVQELCLSPVLFFRPLWAWNSPIPAVHPCKLVLNTGIPSHNAGPFPAFFLLVFISLFYSAHDSLPWSNSCC